jgi:hypothetical protein
MLLPIFVPLCRNRAGTPARHESFKLSRKHGYKEKDGGKAGEEGKEYQAI